MKSKHIAKCYDKKGRLLSVATNSYRKTHPLQSYFAKKVGLEKKIYLHAEIAAIIKAKGEIYHIHVERYYTDGRPAPSKPCPICQEAIAAFGIKKVTFTSES